MVEAACVHNEVGLSGCASSGKSDFMVLWGLINWMAAPTKTKVLMTSTSLKESRRRIWGKTEKYFGGARTGLFKPGKLLSSTGQIRTECEGYKGTDLEGIELIAGEKSSEKEAVGKLIGTKNDRVILLADELSELPESILEATVNLTTNPYFQIIAASNHKSISDTFGKFTEPANGWASVTVDTEEWKTKRGGICLRFDGCKSPNLGHNPPLFRGLYSDKDLNDHQEKLGPKSVQFWRMCRSFPAPAGVADTIYSDADIISGRANETPIWSEARKIRLAALDPSFTSGGDRSVAIFGTLGTTIDGKHTLSRDETVELHEDVTSKEPFDLQIAKLYRDECVKRGIPASHAAYDATGAGISFGTLLGVVWNNGLYPVKFGGGASELPVPSGDTIKQACELYSNRVTEVWFIGKEYMRGGQLKGISVPLMAEMTSRKFETKKDGETKVVAEPKTDMRERNLRSPDEADAWFILIDLARVRFGFQPLGMAGLAAIEAQEKAEDCVYEFDDVYDLSAVLADE